MLWVKGAVEGMPDEVVLRKICESENISLQAVYICGGKSKLDKKIPSYNSAAAYGNWIILRDLDHDADCGPELLEQLLPEPSENMRLRVVIREVESWLMADHAAFASFFGLRETQLPNDVEAIDHPKEFLIRLIEGSRKKAVREDMLPRPGSGRGEGRAYASRLAEFAQFRWSPERAAGICDSLDRCLRRLRHWIQ